MPSGDRAAWMALEWLTGVPLDVELARRRGQGGLSPRECLALMRPTLAALATVHAKGVAHRDLKPANIMLVDTASGPTPKLLDFGIAKIMGDDEEPGAGHTRTGSAQIAFSPLYGSPEQISQGRSGPWTDVHAMGLILTELLADCAPLGADTAGLLYQQIVHPVRPTPAKFGVDVGAWEAVLLRAVDVSPAHRYRDASALLAALESSVDEANKTHSLAPRAPPTPQDASSGRKDLGLDSTQLAHAGKKEATAVTPPSDRSPSRDAETGPRAVAPPRRPWIPVAAGALALAAVGGVVYAVREPTSKAPAAGLVQSALQGAPQATEAAKGGTPAPAASQAVGAVASPDTLASTPPPAVGAPTAEPPALHRGSATRNRLPPSQPPPQASASPAAAPPATPPVVPAAAVVIPPSAPASSTSASSKLDRADPWRASSGGTP
jgi:hypothetical protein